MANLGNTGQRYKLRKFSRIELLGNRQIRVILECGHTYGRDARADASFGYFQDLIERGKRTRCLECPV